MSITIRTLFNALFKDVTLIEVVQFLGFLRRFKYHHVAADLLGVKRIEGIKFMSLFSGNIHQDDFRKGIEILKKAITLFKEDYRGIWDPDRDEPIKYEDIKAALDTYRCGSISPMARRRPGEGVDTYPEFHEECQLNIRVHGNFQGVKGLSPEDALELWMYSWELYAQKFNLKFFWVSSPTEAHVYAYVGPAERNVLAWMEMFDGCVGQHESRYNKDVVWHDDLLLGTAIHENGHGLGIEHSPNGVRSIMAPVMDPTIPNEIDAWLTSKLVPRYGLKEIIPPIPEPPEEPPVIPDPPTPPDNGGNMTIPWEEIFAIILEVIKQCQSKDEAARTIKFRKLRSTFLLDRKLRKIGYSKEVRQEAIKQARMEIEMSSEAEIDDLINQAFDEN